MSSRRRIVRRRPPSDERALQAVTNPNIAKTTLLIATLAGMLVAGVVLVVRGLS